MNFKGLKFIKYIIYNNNENWSYSHSIQSKFGIA